jgi:hypothetical protein
LPRTLYQGDCHNARVCVCGRRKDGVRFYVGAGLSVRPTLLPLLLPLYVHRCTCAVVAAGLQTRSFDFSFSAVVRHRSSMPLHAAAAGAGLQRARVAGPGAFSSPLHAALQGVIFPFPALHPGTPCPCFSVVTPRSSSSPLPSLLPFPLSIPPSNSQIPSPTAPPAIPQLGATPPKSRPRPPNSLECGGSTPLFRRNHPTQTDPPFTHHDLGIGLLAPTSTSFAINALQRLRNCSQDSLAASSVRPQPFSPG